MIATTTPPERDLGTAPVLNGSDSTRSVAYLCARFPKLSEVFVAREVQELMRQGDSVLVFSLLPGESAGTNPGVEVVGPPSWMARALGSVKLLATRPARFVGALGEAIRLSGGRPKDLAENLFVLASVAPWAAEVERRSIDHLHAHFAGAPTTGAMLLARLTGRAFGFTAHANDIFVDATGLERKLRAAQYVVTVTEYNRRHLTAVCPEAAGRVTVLPTGLPATAASGRATPEAGLVLAVGRLVPKKGFLTLVEAMGILKSRGVAARLVIAGGGPQEKALRETIERLGVSESVTLLGATPARRVEELLAQAAVFALPCEVARDGDRDGLPHSIMEAMQIGVPVVSTRVVGIPELIEDGESGLLVEPGDAEALAVALERVLREPELAENLVRRARVRVREHCDLTSIVGRLRRAFRGSMLSIATVALMALAFPGLAEIFPDPQLANPAEHLRAYSNFGKGDPIIGYETTFAAGAVRVGGGDREPLSRIGVRTVPIPVGAGVYTARFSVKGEGVGRLGLYAILVDAQDNALVEQEFFGPGGDFDQDVELTVPVEANHVAAGARLILYVFHDGGGTITLKGLSVTETKGLGRKLAPARKKLSLLQRTTLAEPAFAPGFTATVPALLEGESRLVESAGEGAVYTLEQRAVAVSWTMGVEAPAPFWIKPAKGTETGPLRRVVGAPVPNVAPLPPLPAERGVYLFFYGAYRYGKQPRDLKRDKEQLAALRADGVTGVGIYDDYGLDFHTFAEGKELNGAYLVTMAEAYREAGFTSPMLFTMYGGIDRGRVGWTSGNEEDMRAYLTAVAPWIEQAKAKLGDVPLWVIPADEPDDAQRQGLMLKQAAIWKDVIQTPMAVTTNWQTARRLNNAAKVVLGFGSMPSFEKAREVGAEVSYASLDSHLDPLRQRYLAGVFTWASGINSQAWWHTEAISGRIDSDLDGDQPDFVARESRGGRLTIHYTQVLEGVQDLRLLCALEKIAADNEKVAGFLESVRSSVRPTDRLYAPWNDVAHYDKIMAEARALWRETAPAIPPSTPTTQPDGNQTPEVTKP